MAEPRVGIAGIFGDQPFVIGPGPGPSGWAELKLDSCAIQSGVAGEIAGCIRGDHGFVVPDRRRKIAQPLRNPSQLEREQVRVEAVGPCPHPVEIEQRTFPGSLAGPGELRPVQERPGRFGPQRDRCVIMGHGLPRITVEGVVVGQCKLVPELIGPQADRTLEPCQRLFGPALEHGEQAPFKAGPRARFGRRPRACVLQARARRPSYRALRAYHGPFGSANDSARSQTAAARRACS